MENQNEYKKALHNKTISQKELIISEGKNIIQFNTVNAIDMLNFSGSNQNVEMINNSIVSLSFIHTKELYSLPSETFFTTIMKDIVLYKMSNDATIEIICLNSITSIITHQKDHNNHIKTIKFQFEAEEALILSNMIILGNTHSILLISRPQIELFKEIPYIYMKNESYKRITNMLNINGNYMALIAHNQISIFDIEQLYQCVVSIEINERKNRFMCIVDTCNGRVIDHYNNDDYNNNYKKNRKKNWKILIATGIPKKIELFKMEYYESIKQLIDDDKVVKIDKIMIDGDDNDSVKYLFIMSNYYYIYDVIKRVYVQKIASLLTNRYCFSPYGMIYFSSPAFYTVKYSLKEEE